MTIQDSFLADAKLVELDTTTTLSFAEIDEYSIRHYIQDRLNAWNWTIEVKPMDDGWPEYEDVRAPGVYVDVQHRDVSGVELGSMGSGLIVIIQIIGQNPAQRTRLAELIKGIFRDTVPIYDFVTGNEDPPLPTGEYFITDNVGWDKVPSTYTDPDKKRWRANVTAELRRAE